MARPKRPLTTHDLARLLRCSQSTVSRALRNSPSISKAQRERIQREAERLGYRPDPVVAAFTSRVRGYRRSPGLGAIACLRVAGVQAGWLSPIMEGIRGAAERLGYGLETLEYEELGGTPQALERVMRARGIQGLIILPVPWGFTLESMNFEVLAVSQLGPSLHAPSFDIASTNYFLNAQSAYRGLMQMGHVRIGYASQRFLEERLDYQWWGGYAIMADLHGPPQRIPGYCPIEPGPAGFRAWVKRYRITAFMGPGSDWLLRGWKRGGAEIAPPVFASVVGTRQGVGQGIDERNELAGASAVQLVVSRINTNRYGIPEVTTHVQTAGVWVVREGTSEEGAPGTAMEASSQETGLNLKASASRPSRGKTSRRQG